MMSEDLKGVKERIGCDSNVKFFDASVDQKNIKCHAFGFEHAMNSYESFNFLSDPEEAIVYFETRNK
ncbi:hypothetical protein BGX20_004978, partial [Mortierella sp. AD010]